MFGVGEALGIGASLAGGILGSDAAGDAADSANAALMLAMEELKAADDRTRRDTSPYRNLGSAGADRLSFLLGLDSSGGRGQQYTLKDFEDTQRKNAIREGLRGAAVDENVAMYAPEQYRKYLNGELGDDFAVDKRFGQFANLEDRSEQEGYGSLLKGFTKEDLANDVVYNSGLQFGMDRGTNAIEARNRASGSSDSGAVLKELLRFGNDYGSTKANESYNRFMNDKGFTLGALTGTTNIGQNAVNTSAQSGMNTGNALAQMQAGIGANNAAAGIGSANAWSGALGGIGNVLGGMDWSSVLRGGGGGATASGLAGGGSFSGGW